ncbi:MAG: hypothetical protein KatS3mg108_0738 [Isosphaeraceae bacterium]|jgi:HEAT repeat protein|nr:MAG: hypothetical protein KatS3mg108_0738 [Isosphaeraceae bacterium]
MSERPVTDAERILELIASFGSPYEKDRVAAAFEAGSLGSPVVPALADALRHHNPFVREQAALALRSMGPAASAAVPDLIDSLADEVPYVREKAAEALGAIGPPAEVAIPRLIRLLGEDFGLVLDASALALAALGPPAVPSLVGLLKHEVGGTRAYAALALGKIGPAAASAVPDLIDLIEEPHRFAWLSGIESLGRIGPAAAGASPALVGSLAREDETGRFYACRALICIGPAAVPALLDATLPGIERRYELDDYPRVWSRDLLCGILQALGPRVLPDLIKALADDEPASSRAWETLSTWDAEAESYLKDALRDRNAVVRTKADALLARRRAASLVECPLSEFKHRFPQSHDVLLFLLTTAATAPKTKEQLRMFRSLITLGSFRRVAIEEARQSGIDGQGPDHSGPASRVRRLAKSLGAPLTCAVEGDGRKRTELTDLGRALGDWIEANPHWID